MAAPKKDEYVRTARVLAVTDGDSLKVLVRLGFGACYEGSFRVLGVDTPETHGVEVRQFPAGKKAAAFTAKKVLGKDVTFQSFKVDKYGGRYDAKLFFEENGKTVDLAQAIILAGLGRPYLGEKKAVWTDEELAKIAALTV
jgi:endonuclease YncB( thermonuclease family)